MLDFYMGILAGYIARTKAQDTDGMTADAYRKLTVALVDADLVKSDYLKDIANEEKKSIRQGSDAH